MNRFYVYRTGEAGDTFDADHEPDALGIWCKFDEAAYIIAQRDARIADLEAALIHEYHELTGGGDYRGEKLITAQDKINYMIARVPK